jgi:hypothetical protein
MHPSRHCARVCRWRAWWSRAHWPQMHHASYPVSVRRPASFALSFLRTPPRDDAPALWLTFGSADTWCRDSHPAGFVPCTAHTSGPGWTIQEADRQVMAGSSHRESPRKSRLCDTLLTLLALDSMKTAPAKARILGAEHELPTATVVRSSQATPARRRGQLCTDAVRTRAWKVCGGSGSETVARLNRKHWRH